MEQNCKNLIEAVKQDDIICVVRLLKEGENPNVRDEFGKTPLRYAVLQDPIMVETLLKHGADPDVADDSGVTPLHVASMFGLYDVVKLLISYGRINVNVQDEGGRTPLHKAATGCRSKVVWLLLINGADPNARDSIGHTPLHGAVYRQGTDAVHKGECKVITPLFSASPFPLLHGWDQGIAEVAHLNQPFFQK